MGIPPASLECTIHLQCLPPWYHVERAVAAEALTRRRAVPAYEQGAEISKPSLPRVGATESATPVPAQVVLASWFLGPRMLL
jgi:hypothetical protein